MTDETKKTAPAEGAEALSDAKLDKVAGGWEQPTELLKVCLNDICVMQCNGITKWKQNSLGKWYCTNCNSSDHEGTFTQLQEKKKLMARP